MLKPTAVGIREAIIKAAEKQRPDEKLFGANLQSRSVLEDVRNTFCPNAPDSEIEEMILTVWHDLLREGFFAWGMNIGNSDPPFFHFTDRGRQSLERLSRDPRNPAGYLRHLASKAALSPVSNSYLTEALNCFNSGLNKAAAVMIGGASERVVLELRDELVNRLQALGQPVTKKLTDWKVKTVLIELQSFFDQRKSSFSSEFRDEFEAYWAAFAQQIRTVRNDAGHPVSVDPVTEDTVHASFLIFPEQARLAAQLLAWVRAMT